MDENAVNSQGASATSNAEQNTDSLEAGRACASIASENIVEEKSTEDVSDDSKYSGTCLFFREGRCRFGERCRNLHSGLPGQPPPQKSKTEKTNVEELKDKEKKPPMKTAEDVIARIQWDDQLPKDSFTIGYLDRFLGIIEKPFSAFSWEDFASVGYDVLAIPKHRIQYFKYRDLVVWDKATRTDNVFGSTGGGQTILDIVEKYQQQENNFDTKDSKGSEEDIGALALRKDYASDKDDDDDDDEAEETHLNHQRGGDVREHRPPQRCRPSHFVAIRIASEDVRSAVKEVQNRLVKVNPALMEFCTPVPTLHLTLCLLHLDSPEEIQTALTTLQELRCETQRLLPPALILHFKRLNDFHSRVLYLEPATTPELSRFSRALERGFSEKGLTVISPPSYDTIHLTIAKIPRRAARKDPSVQLPRTLYGDSLEDSYGSQQVDSLSFCYAGSTRRTDGFYTTLMEFALY
ncbi:leukocyte receptor cluster member 9 [Ambystoma mexicanum]|uniref:leukocyte receptor cluster member 9 n=1 Tax=Ambystoma mexicanum TaxID=8296 RepID=UPI0037E8C9DC